VRGSAQAAPNSVRQELERLLSSDTFASAEGLRRFLRFVVEETLAGRNAELKEYVVGSVGLGRGPAFDPRNDSIVRVEAVKLRRKLAAYYAAEGGANTLQISLPKGSYVPSFSYSAPRAPQRLRFRSLVPAAVVATLAITTSVWVLAGAHKRPAAAHPGSLAILPFVDLNGDPANEHIGDGLADELITVLSASPGLRVVARTSAFQYKNQPRDVQTIGRDLRVAAVLEGNYRRRGDRLNVAAKLVRTVDGLVIWSQSFDQDIDQMSAAQREISSAIAAALQAKQQSQPGRYPSGPGAYDAYMRGLWLLQRGGPANLDKSAAAFQEAIAADPKFALAYAQLAIAFFEQESIGYRRPHDVMPKAREAALRAITLDAMLPEAHLALGMVRVVYEWDWEGGCGEIERSLEINPGSARAHVIKAGLCLSRAGRFDEARTEVRLAQTLDPASHATSGIEVTLAFAERNYDAVIDRCLKIAEVAPDTYWVYSALANSYSRQGNIVEARRMIELASRYRDDSAKTLSVLAQLHAWCPPQ